MSHDRRRDRQCPALAACLSLACAAAPAHAQLDATQLSGSVTVVSEYSVRGISLSAGHPAVQLRVEGELRDGWYLGGFASPATLGDDGRQAELIVYGGRAGRLPSGSAWDAGLSRVSFLRDRQYDYTEFHAGVVFDRASARLFLSPAYYGDKATAYLDLNAFHPLDERNRLTFHAGFLHSFGSYPGANRDRSDLRIGLATTLGDCILQLGWQTLLRSGNGGPPRARALSGSATIRF